MESEKLTHWKKLKNKTFLGAWDIEPGTMPDVTIIGVGKATAKANQKAPEEEVDVIYFKEFDKGMILNNVNSDQISKVLQTPFVEQWNNKRVKLFVKKGVKKPGQKDPVEAIRISNTLPAPIAKEKTFLTPDLSTTWENAVDAIKKGVGIEKIKSRYKLTEENEKLLLSHGAK